MVFRDASDHVWVETLWLGSVTVMKEAVAVSRLHIAFATATGGKQCHQDTGGYDRLKKAHDSSCS
jgi:hypothetical protein